MLLDQASIHRGEFTAVVQYLYRSISQKQTKMFVVILVGKVKTSFVADEESVYISTQG